ncbi:hypothetical protein A9Q68_09855 [Streptococcus bovimastitidis]|uniref:SDR-like Ig domain-containing protein n=2 Tax=Streptococcus bovimastitidis TaxID=1856638 RepID=A0A1L8MKC3_9STRE|nr:hypothetical protein A9Q68_09855 [Streptococcus bovimastitidis]
MDRAPGGDFTFDFQKDTVAPSDYITFTLNNNLDYHGVTSSSIYFPALRTPDGVTIAEANYDPTTN